MTYEDRIAKAMDTIERFGGIDGGHHKAWVIDQVVRALLGGDEGAYRVWLAGMCVGEDGPDTYEWDEGIAP